MIILEQGSEADGASPKEGRGSQTRLRLQEASRRTGMADLFSSSSYFFVFLDNRAPEWWSPRRSSLTRTRLRR